MTFLNIHRFYFPRTDKDWNMLPEEAVQAETLDEFRSLIRDILRGLLPLLGVLPWGSAQYSTRTRTRQVLFGFRSHDRFRPITALTLVKMAAPMKVVMDDFRRCLIHFPGFEQEPFETFTQTRWEKVRECTQFWQTISHDNPSAVSARMCKEFLNTNYEDISSDVGYHPMCYRRYTDKKRQECARKQQARCRVSPESTVTVARPTEPPNCSPPKRLRSTSSFRSPGPVLPAVCIICKKAERYITVNHKRQKDVLHQAETDTAGKNLSLF